MTLQEFLEKLTKTKVDMEWDLADMELRAYAGGLLICPITAVCFVETGQLYAVSDWKFAADDVGLPEKIANEIIRAADNPRDGDFGHLRIEMERMID